MTGKRGVSSLCKKQRPNVSCTRRILSIITLFFFCTVDAVFPLKALASTGNISSQGFSEIYKTLPLLMRGVQDAQRLKHPQFYVHHAPDPVNALNGNLFLAYQDLFIPARGFPLEVSRTYNSRGTTKGLFGYGWSSSLETGLIQGLDGSISITEWDGSVSVYYVAPQAAGSSSERIYKPSVPSIQNIIKETDGTFTRVLGNGKKETFSPQGRLLRKEDAHGNGLKFIYDPESKVLLGISDTSERHVWFKYTESGFIRTLTDPLNRTLTYDYDAKGDLLGVTGFDGSVTRFSCDSDHNLTTITFADGSEVRNVYDRTRDRIVRQEGPGEKRTLYEYRSPAQESLNRKTVVTDANGNKTTYSYFFKEDTIRQLTITDAMGGTRVTEYDEHGKVLRKTDPNGNSISYGRGAYGRVRTVTDPMGATWEFEFLEGCDCRDNKPTRIKDPMGRSTQFHYDKYFNLVEVINPLNYSTKFEYGPQGDFVRSVGNGGTQTRYEYDSYGNLAQVINPNGSGVRYIRNVLGLVTGWINPEGHRYRFRYDNKGRLTDTVNPMGYNVKLSYDPLDRVVGISDSNGKSILTYTYYGTGWLKSFSGAAGNMTRMGYDKIGNVIKISDPKGNEWQYAYDNLSRLIQTADPLNNKHHFEYDYAGNLTGLSNPQNARTTLSYDRNNRLAQICDPLGNCSRLTYDLLGNRTAVIDPEGNQRQYGYDALNRLVSATNALGKTMEYHRDEQGNVIKQVDALGNGTQLQYDRGGRLVKMIDPIGNTTSCEYNASNQLAKIIRPDGQAVKFQYNPLNLLTDIISDDSTINLSYNKRGQLIGSSNKDSNYRYNYNERGLLSAVEDTLRKKTLQYKYDSKGNKLESSLLPNRLTTRYEYDSLSRMIGLTSPSGKAYHFGYDGTSKRTSLSFPNGVKTAYAYDLAGRMTEIDTRNKNGEVLDHETYRYNRLGSMTAMTDMENKITSYKYDSLNRLTEASYPDQDYERFIYDDMGNIQSKSTSTETVHYKYNKASQLVSGGDTFFQYDANGNMIQKNGKDGSFKYRYDDLGRLRDIDSVGGKQMSYTYDPLFQRTITKTDGAQTHTIFDGDNPIATLNKKLEVKENIVFGPRFDEVLAQEFNGKTQFFHKNALGSITATSDETGEKLSSISYRAFGRPHVVSGSLSPFSFAGRPFNPETGLTHLRFRDYDSGIGRFTQKEPLGLLIGWENPYVYAANNPINYIDVYGLLSWYGWVGVGAIVAVAAVLAAPAVLAAAGVTAATSSALVAGAAAAQAATVTALCTGAAAGGVISGGISVLRGNDIGQVLKDTAVGAAVGGVGAAATAAAVAIAGPTALAYGVTEAGAGLLAQGAGLAAVFVGGAGLSGLQADFTEGDINGSAMWGATGGTAGYILGVLGQQNVSGFVAVGTAIAGSFFDWMHQTTKNKDNQANAQASVPANESFYCD